MKREVKVAVAQIEGGAMQGVAAALYESIALSDGIVTNPSFMDYKIPFITDMPA